MPQQASPLVQPGQRHAASSTAASVVCEIRAVLGESPLWDAAGAATHDGERRSQLFRLEGGSVSVQADGIGMSTSRDGDPLSGLLYAAEVPAKGSLAPRFAGAAP